MTRQYFKTTADIRNPAGSKRAGWRSPLERSGIPADFVWYTTDGADPEVNHGAAIHDAHHGTRVELRKPLARTLLAALQSCSEPAEESILTVLADYPWRADTLVNAICRAKNISPTELRAILAADPP